MAIARIAGVTLPQNKRIEIALTYIFGVGRPRANTILKTLSMNPDTRTMQLTEEDINRLREEVKKYQTEGDLKRDIMLHIKRLKEIGTYRGSRHAKRLPARGQRTKTNSRTVRGNVRKTMGSGRRSATEKT